MDVRIIDRARNVTVVPTKTPDKGDYANAVRQLAAGQAIHTGRIEIECDQAYFDALKAEKPEGLVIEENRPPLAATLDGVPIIVVPTQGG